jgi:hypothetical protein
MQIVAHRPQGVYNVYVWLKVLLLGFVMSLTRYALGAAPDPVKINFVTVEFTTLKAGGGDLNSVSFSIENTANRPLAWVILRATTRSYDGALLQTDNFEEDLRKKPIAPNDARRITHFISIRGFLIGGKRGSVDLSVVDYGFISGESRVSAYEGRLPPCPGSYERTTWTNCGGSFTSTSGAKYIGEFRDGLFHGQGILYDAHGSILQSGNWENDIFIRGR